MSRKSSHKTSRKSTTARRRPVSLLAQTAVGQAQPAKVDFATEYHYVLKDLRRFGILAVAMFATLIALALVIG